MYLLSCEHPKRVYNKYTGEYLFVPCGECYSCKNRRAKRMVDLLERERSNSLYTLFVTLTYKETCLPVYNMTGGFDDLKDVPDNYRGHLVSTRERDKDTLVIEEKLFDDDADRRLYNYFLQNKGIPYCSRSDIQLFNKRLNKWFYNNVSYKYKNFRYFVVSELGSTSLRPHFHAIYFVNDEEVARRFNDAVLACWKFGRTDCQFVEKSACSYVSQYINKFFDLPSFYKARQIRPFYLCSRNPFIGAYNKYAQSDEEIFNSGVVQTFTRKKASVEPVLVELDKSTENRLYPKCPFYGKISHSLRTQLYTIVRRFPSKTGFKGFAERIRHFIYGQDKYSDKQICGLSYVEYINTLSCYDISFKESDLLCCLRNFCDCFSESGLNWLRRLYYLSRKVLKNAERFGVSVFAYVQKIDEYYNKKELYLLKLMYDFQSEYVKEKGNCSDDLSLMYCEYLHSCGCTVGSVLENYTPKDVIKQRMDAESIYFGSKKTHFKNMYLDSLKEKNNRFFVELKNFYHAKKRNEIVEALTT